MSRIGRFGRPRAWRLGLIGLLAAVAMLATAARCIENVRVYVDADGYTHIVGEMYNETEIQGSAIMLRGTLYDGAGNVIASKDSPICPPDSQPGAQSMFDIRFDNPNLPPHTRYSVNAVGGTVLNQRLPDPNVLVLQTDAFRLINVPPIPFFPWQDGDILFQFGIRNRSATVYTGAQGCSAAYNNQGQIVATDAGPFFSIGPNGEIGDAILGNANRVDVFMEILNVPLDAAYVRAWIWLGQEGDPTSQYQFIMTPPITIQTEDLFQ
jgi:hypothetical protein